VNKSAPAQTRKREPSRLAFPISEQDLPQRSWFCTHHDLLRTLFFSPAQIRDEIKEGEIL